MANDATWYPITHAPSEDGGVSPRTMPSAGTSRRPANRSSGADYGADETKREWVERVKRAEEIDDAEVEIREAESRIQQAEGRKQGKKGGGKRKRAALSEGAGSGSEYDRDRSDLEENLP